MTAGPRRRCGWPFGSTLDGARPSGTLEWVSPAVPAVTRAATGAGHWAAGRRQRALAAWAGAAGSGLIAWGRGTEGRPAEVDKNIQQNSDLLQLVAPAACGPPFRRYTAAAGCRNWVDVPLVLL